jgi:hypothetical protein
VYDAAQYCKKRAYCFLSQRILMPSVLVCFSTGESVKCRRETVLSAGPTPAYTAYTFPPESWSLVTNHLRVPGHTIHANRKFRSPYIVSTVPASEANGIGARLAKLGCAVAPSLQLRDRRARVIRKHVAPFMRHRVLAVTLAGYHCTPNTKEVV